MPKKGPPRKPTRICIFCWPTRMGCPELNPPCSYLQWPCPLVPTRKGRGRMKNMMFALCALTAVLSGRLTPIFRLSPGNLSQSGTNRLASQFCHVLSPQAPPVRRPKCRSIREQAWLSSPSRNTPNHASTRGWARRAFAAEEFSKRFAAASNLSSLPGSNSAATPSNEHCVIAPA